MAILTKGTTFADGDQVTSTKLNNLVDSAAFVAGSSGSTDDATLEVASGQLRVKTIQTGNIANSAVTTAKIADSTGATDGVTTAKLATGAVTSAKVADANITAAKLSGAQTGTAPIFGVRAFGSFNGTASSPITPISSGNVASITRTGTGVYQVVLTTAMSSSNYCVVANATYPADVSFASNCSVTIVNSSTFTLQTATDISSFYNSTLVSFVVMQ